MIGVFGVTRLTISAMEEGTMTAVAGQRCMSSPKSPAGVVPVASCSCWLGAGAGGAGAGGAQAPMNMANMDHRGGIRGRSASAGRARWRIRR